MGNYPPGPWPFGPILTILIAVVMTLAAAAQHVVR